MAQFGGGANPFGAPSGMGGGGYEQQPSTFSDYGGGGGYDQSAGYGQDTGYGQNMAGGGAGIPQQPYGVAARPRVDVEAEGEVDPSL